MIRAAVGMGVVESKSPKVETNGFTVLSGSVNKADGGVIQRPRHSGRAANHQESTLDCVDNDFGCSKNTTKRDIGASHLCIE